ncbi:MAG: carboxynorspermidine decarboxylase [Planctomycetaceae bacterium]|nr:carboxynorspermidine decarboxylase [Planctomycetaceae bacterium]
MQLRFDPGRVPTPCYVCDLGLLEDNLRLLSKVQEQADCKILLALKGFAQWSTFHLVRRYLAGAAATGLHEALLAHEHLGGELHVYSPALADDDLKEILKLADHVCFNSFSQWERFRPLVRDCERPVRCGLRINPQHSEARVPIYDPCATHSRLGVTQAEWRDDLVEGLDGLHFHTLCQLGADALERTVRAVESRFGHFLERARWINLGGGHHITRPGYDVELLIEVVRGLRQRWGVEVYLEPGEAIAFEAGFLVASVLDVVKNDIDIAVLDVSASAHMPDVLEMPYRPEIVGAGRAGEFAHNYRLAGATCLAGDVIGDYSFSRPLQIGDRIVIRDMGPYTMVKNTTFNGVRLPSIATYNPEGDEVRVVRSFGYADYRDRLS